MYIIQFNYIWQCRQKCMAFIKKYMDKISCSKTFDRLEMLKPPTVPRKLSWLLLGFAYHVTVIDYDGIYNFWHNRQVKALEIMLA